MKELPEVAAGFLCLALNDSKQRLRWLQAFQGLVWNSVEPIGDEGMDEILVDLAGDLDLYEPNVNYRSE